MAASEYIARARAALTTRRNPAPRNRLDRLSLHRSAVKEYARQRGLTIAGDKGERSRDLILMREERSGFLSIVAEGKDWRELHHAIAALRHAGKLNPVPPSKFVQARELGRAFSGHEPQLREKLDASRALGLPVKGDHPLFAFGELLEVRYRTVRDGREEHYKHAFRKQSRPLLAARHDGKRIYIVGGRYRFTESGINDD